MSNFDFIAMFTASVPMTDHAHVRSASRFARGRTQVSHASSFRRTQRVCGIVLTTLALSGCQRVSVQKLQADYILCADELQMRTQDLIALRDEIAEVWDFALKQKRANKLKIAVNWMHKNDPDARLKKLLESVSDVQTRLQDLGRYSTDPTHKQWHDDLAEIFSMFDLGVTNAREVPRGTLGAFKEETEQLRVELLTRLSALSITLKVPTS